MKKSLEVSQQKQALEAIKTYGERIDSLEATIQEMATKIEKMEAALRRILKPSESTKP